MKKIFFILSALFLFFTTNAQREETATSYSYFIGGSVNFSESDNISYLVPLLEISQLRLVNDSESSYYSVDLNFGKYLNERWAVGITANFSKSTSNNEEVHYSITFDYKEYGAGLFARCILNPGDKFNLILVPYANYSHAVEEINQEVLNKKFDTDIFSFGTSIGALYRLSDRFNATVNFGGINYIRGSHSGDVNEQLENKDFHYFGLNFNMKTIFIGFEYMF